ncbi:E3 ubiquitin-protein ligase SINAT4 [Linum perenne]
MELDSIECVSSSDGIDEEEIPHDNLHHHHHHQNAAASNNARPGINGVAGPNAITPATSVHELLECPVCTNSMYPPIHQVRVLFRLC